MNIAISSEKLEKTREAIRKIENYYKKPMVIENRDGSFYRRDEGVDTSAENIIAWGVWVDSLDKGNRFK